jgi:hypothetical protein
MAGAQYESGEAEADQRLRWLRIAAMGLGYLTSALVPGLGFGISAQDGWAVFVPMTVLILAGITWFRASTVGWVRAVVTTMAIFGMAVGAGLLASMALPIALCMAEILVDVVALAGQLGKPAVRHEDPSLPLVANTAGRVPDAPFAGASALAASATAGATAAPSGVQECPLGHANATGARFCAECGLTVGDVTLAPRVDLEAVREAVRPGSSLDQAERARRDREHVEAIAANARAEQEIVDITQQEDPSAQKIRIHFVEDGFTWAGKVWNRGDELELGPQHPRWEDALRWIRLTKQEQFQRYGRVFFDIGPFPGRVLAPGTEALLPTAGVAQWSVMRGGVPARPSPDGDGALVPRLGFCFPD